MRMSFYWLLPVALAVVCACGKRDDSVRSPSHGPPREVLLRFHFCGTTRLATETNATHLVQMSEQPAFQALWIQTLKKLTHAPYQLLQQWGTTTATNDFANAFSELLHDLTRAESFVGATGNSNGIAELVLAVRLPPDRAEFWQTNLLSILESWIGEFGKTISAGVTGWRLNKNENSIRLVRSGDWTLIGWGQDKCPLQEDYLKRISESGRPALTASDSWAELFLDGPNLPRWFQVSPRSWIAKSPVAKLTLTGRDGEVRIKGDFTLSESFVSRFGPWQVPTNLIREPLISFTAVRGIEAQVRNLIKGEELLLGGVPDQYFVWAGATYPVQTLAAAPLNGATNDFHSFATQLRRRYNPYLQTAKAGVLVLETNTPDAETLRWTDIPPFLTPFLTTSRDANGDFLFAGVHPNWGDTNLPGPSVLYHHLASQTNLIYYDWELTGPHAYSWRAIINLVRHYFEKPRLEPSTASIDWMNTVSNKLGNTITEIRLVGSNRLDLVRQGAVGLTGIEILALAHWLESPQFPINAINFTSRINKTSPVLRGE